MNITLTSLYFISPETGWITGYSGKILKTNNGGQNWFTQESQTLSNLNDVQFISDSIGWVVGDGVALRTTNGGQNWNVNTEYIEGSLLSVCFTTPDTGWAAGSTSSFLSGAIYYTVDGGENWIQQYSNTPRLYRYSLRHSNCIYNRRFVRR